MTDPAAYLDALEGTRREEVARLHELIRAALPELAVEVEAGATGLGYGPYRYRYAFKRLDDLDPDALTELLHEAGRHPPMDAIP